jgi:hypothetical protein
MDIEAVVAALGTHYDPAEAKAKVIECRAL